MTVLASVIVRSEAMKQSRATDTILDCFIAWLLAMTYPCDSASSRRNSRPSLAVVSPSNNGGRREDRVSACTRVPSREKTARKREDHRYRRNHTGLPCAVVYGLYVISSVNLADCHRPPRCACASSALAPSLWGARTTRFRRPPRCRSSTATKASTASPAPRLVTTANRPSAPR